MGLFFRRLAQAALEYMVVVGIALLVLTPIALEGMQSVDEFKKDMNVLKAHDALAQVADAAKIVYFQGPPSTMTIRVIYPDKIVLSNASGTEAYFRIDTGGATTDIVEFFDFNVTGNISGGAGERTIYIEALPNAVNITRTG